MTFKKHFDKGKELAGKVIEEVGSKVSEIADTTSEFYEESGAKEKVSTVTGATSNQLDVISGQKMYDLVQEKMELQSRINDVLAYKLQEAIIKIDELDNKIDSLKSNK